ncbi:MAG: hypothetical protein AB1422_01465 [bacterium]
MKKGKNKGLLDKKRFEWMEEERIRELKALSIEQSTEALESLTSPSILNAFLNNFSLDNPLCLKLGLKNGFIAGNF